MKKIAVCVPTYNESDIIETTVKKIDNGLQYYDSTYETYIVNCDNMMDYEEIIKLSEIASKIPLIIQPITTNDKSLIVDTATIFRISDAISSARIIPQTHNYMGIL